MNSVQIKIDNTEKKVFLNQENILGTKVFGNQVEIFLSQDSLSWSEEISTF